MSFYTELKRRNVFKVAITYSVVAWMLLQVSDTLGPALHLPEWFVSAVAFLLALGFPVAIIFAWAFDLTPEGLKRETNDDPAASITRKTTHKLSYVILAVLVLALGYFVFDKFVLAPSQDAAEIESAVQLSQPQTTEIESVNTDNSIAVLPFINMSSDLEQEYFSDGITEEILNLLVKIPELKVTSRTSVFSFKGQNIDIPTVAKKLGVAHILEGSVRKAGNRIRITAQLIEAKNDVHLWSETYERKLDDIFAIQDEIAREVVNALQIQLLGETPSIAATNIEAYKLYLRGKHFATQNTKESIQSSITTYQDAIALDANFAPSWAGLSNILRRQGLYYLTNKPETMEASRQAATRALELDDQLAEAWLALAEIQFRYDWDWSKAEVSIRTALKYGPQNAPVLRSATWIALTLGEPERALNLAQLAVDLDPLDFSSLANLGTTYWAVGQLKEEERIYRHILELYPNSAAVKSWLAATLTRQGKPEEALQYLNFDSENKWQRAMSTVVLHSLGRHQEEQQIRQGMIKKYSQSWPFGVVLSYAWHGDPDKAFEWLDSAFKQKDAYITQLIFNPWLASLHNDPRWEKTLDKVGLLKYWHKSQAKLNLP